ncbi:MAG: hypothetical protein HFF44_06000 [Lawsonibacter sp.]|nr:hypothetical protein [Lawsonibacter sp.]
MDDLMKCLYDFTLERRMGTMYQDPEYEEVSRGLESQLETVQKDMTEQQEKEFSLLLINISAQTSIEKEHLFRASLGLTRELRALII